MTRKISRPLRLAPALALSIACLAGSGDALHAQAIRAADRIPYIANSPHPYPGGGGNAPVWTEVIEHPGATFIGVHFDRFELAPGDRLVVRSESGLQRHVYTGRGRAELGTFWASHIKGDVAILELFSPGQGGGAWGLSVDMVAAGFVDLGKDPSKNIPAGPEAICGSDDKENAICYNDGLGGDDDATIYNRSRAVARLLIENTLLCTGWLVGCEGHLFTNNHCIDDQMNLPGITPATAAINTDYEFLSEAPACGTANCQLCHPGGIWGGAATLIQRDVGLDYAFIQLAGNPQNTYGSFALDDRDAVVNERIYIPQHPGGRAKEIAVSSSDSTDPSGFCEVFGINEPTCTGGSPDVGYFCDTEGGSSGSPVVAYTTHQVISLHHCADCANRGVPINDVIADLGATLPACAFNPLPILGYDSNGLDDSLGNNDGVADPGELLTVPVDLFNLGSGGATLVSATLSTTEPLATLLDDSADWPDIAALAAATSLTPHFAVSLDPSLPCGTFVDLDLAIASAEGSFNSSFGLQVGTNLAGTLMFDSTDTPIAIPDNNPPGITSFLSVGTNDVIGDLNVFVDVTHTWRGDLIVELTSPAGTTVRLQNRTGSSADDIFTTYDQDTIPDGPGSMADFDGENMLGNWKLSISDNAGLDIGTLNEWSLIIEESANFVCNGASAPSGNSDNLSVSHAAGSDLLLGWGGSCKAGDTDYEVYEGTLGSFSSHSPLTCGTLGATTWTLTPSSGNNYYLVVPTNGSREGSYGLDSGSTERGQGVSACLTQQASTCP